MLLYNSVLYGIGRDMPFLYKIYEYHSKPKIDRKVTYDMQGKVGTVKSAYSKFHLLNTYDKTLITPDKNKNQQIKKTLINDCNTPHVKIQYQLFDP